jgi:hypothetical protein
MAEPDFERRLERLFAEAPALADDEVFADRVERRLHRGWTARRWLIGVAGAAGGVIGASQLVFSSVFHRMAAVEGSARALTSGLPRTEPAQWITTLPSGGLVVWIAIGVAIVLIGFVFTRVIEEI